MGRPAVLVNNLDQGNAKLAATLLSSRHYRCVWFDPIACVFVHDSFARVVEAHEVDFAARHFAREAESSRDDPATLAAMARAPVRHAPAHGPAGGRGEEDGLDAPGAGLLPEAPRDRPPGARRLEAGRAPREFPRAHRRHPSVPAPVRPGLRPLARAVTHELTKALEIDPEDGVSLYTLATLFEMRAMDEAALPRIERFTEQPRKNLSQQARSEGRGEGPRAPGPARPDPVDEVGQPQRAGRGGRRAPGEGPGRDRRRGDRGRLSPRGPPLGMGRSPGGPPTPPRPAREGPGRLARRPPRPPPRSGRPGSP